MRAWVTLLRSRPGLLRLWLGGLVSLVGDWLGFVAVSLLALRSGGGAVGLAVLFAAHSLPHALLAPVAGVVADRADRRALLVWANVVEGGLTVLAAALAAGGHAGAVTALVLVRSAVGAIVVPAEVAALKGVVASEELVAANALLSATWSVTYVVGMVAGGVLAALGPAPALALDALSFLVAAAVLASLPRLIPSREGADTLAPVSAGSGGVAAAARATVRDLAVALRYVVPRPPLLGVVLAKAPMALAGGAGWLALNVIAETRSPFGTAAASLGVLQALRGTGTGLGPLVGQTLVARGGAPERLAHASSVVGFAAIAAFAAAASLAPSAWLAPGALAVAALVWGSGSGANWVLSSAELQRRAPDGLTGRLAALDDLATTVGQVVGAFAAAAVIAVAGGPTAAALAGVALGGIAWLALRVARLAAGAPALALGPGKSADGRVVVKPPE